MNDSAIPWTVARLYARDAGLEPDVFSLFWRCISMMNAADQEWHAENKRT